jgi:hypothetical protein
VKRDEQLKWVLGVGFPDSALDLLLDLLLSLLSVTAKTPIVSSSASVDYRQIDSLPGEVQKLVLVRPKNRLVLSNVHT